MQRSRKLSSSYTHLKIEMHLTDVRCPWVSRSRRQNNAAAGHVTYFAHIIHNTQAALNNTTVVLFTHTSIYLSSRTLLK